jgi:beta-lactamase regulating signal transducer with metallopeptidase domain/Tol biopolymer transport system component
MEWLETLVWPFLQWLWQTTLIASLVICLILAVQRSLGHKLGPRWSHALWLVLLVRMVVPWAPQSRISLLNLLPSSVRQAQPPAMSTLTEQDRGFHSAAVSDAAETATPQDATTSPSVQKAAPPKPQTLAEAEQSAGPPFLPLRRILPLLWLAGAVLVSAYLLAGHFALWRIVKRERPLLDQSTLELFEECKAQMGVQTIVAAVPTDQVASPALFGFVRPRLLLPRQMLETAGRDEMRYVFLHELAHLKRHDIYLAWIASLLQVLHWFNPVVWFAFHHMRIDREVACDALVLAYAGEQESQKYGRAIVALLQRLSRSRPLPAMAGILETKSQMKRRIAMITQFKNNSYRWSPLALVLLVLLACVTLVNARQDGAAQNPPNSTSAGEPARQPAFQQVRIHNKILPDALLSPDGKNIAFVSQDKLWIVPRTSKLGPDYPGLAQLVDTGETKVEWAGLAWSGDGQWIAFSNVKRDEEPKGQSRIYVVPVTGGKPKEIYENYRGERVMNYRMSLSPNGKTLAFSSADGNDLHIYTISVDGGVPKRLVEAPAREPVFSPDGKTIVYVEDKFLGVQGGGLWVVPAEGGASKRVADAENATSPVWSPDGRMVAFLDANDHAVARQIHIVRIDEDAGSPVKKMTVDCPQGVDRVLRLTGWTPDNKIGAIFEGHMEFGLYTLPSTGGATTLIARGTYAQHPRWTPDGKRIVYSNNLQGINSGWTNWGTAWMPADGGEATVVPVESDAKIGKPAIGTGNNISPDGKTFVFSGRKAGEGEGTMCSHIWTLPLEGGKPTQLTNGPASVSDFFPCWSADRKAIAFIRAKNSGNMAMQFQEPGIQMMPAEGGEPKLLTSPADAVAFGSIAWSPDGRLLAYFSADREWSPDSLKLKVIPAQGGESRVVGKMERIGVNTEMVWSPDSKRIALNGKLYDKVIKIMSVDDGSTADLKLDLVDPSSIWHLDWSHDGSRFVFAGCQGSGDPEFWIVENLPLTTSTGDSK